MNKLSPMFSFWLTGLGCYQLILWIPNIDCGSFTSNAFEPRVFVDGSSCLNPLTLSCGDTLLIDFSDAIEQYNACSLLPDYGKWIEIIGSGKYETLTFLDRMPNYYSACIYEGYCDSLFLAWSQAISNNNQIRIPSELGKRYAIFFYDHQELGTTVMVTHSCTDLVEGSSCQNIIPLHCGDTLKSFLNPIQSSYNFCNLDYEQVNWFRFRGDGEIVSLLSLQGSGSFIIYKGKCDQYSCYRNLYFDSLDKQILFFEEDIDYFFAVGASDLKLRITCDPPYLGGSCIDSYEMLIDSTFELDIGSPYLDKICSELRTAPIWFKYYPSYSHSVSLNNESEIPLHLDLIVGSCLFPSCMSEGITIDGLSSAEFDVKLGDNYFFVFNNDTGNTDSIRFKMVEVLNSFISPCRYNYRLDSLVMPNTNFPNGKIQAWRTISSASTTLQSSAYYHWTAGDSIVLNPGFTIDLGATFKASIQPCDP